MCKKTWSDINSFLSSDELIFAGYQANFSDPENGFFLFNHEIKECGTSIAIYVKDLLEFYKLPNELEAFMVWKEDDCTGLCSNVKNMGICQSKTCKGKIIRDIIGRIKSDYNK